MSFELYQPVIRESEVELSLSDVDWGKGVVVRSTNWLGDALMTLPALYQLRKAMPENATFDIACPEKLETFWQCVPWVDNVISFKSKRVTDESQRLINELEAGVAVVLPNSFGSARDLFCSSIPIRLGRKGRFRGYMLTHKLPPFKRKKGEDKYHQASEYFDLIEPFGQVSRTIKYPPLYSGLVLPGTAAAVMKRAMRTSIKGRPLLLMAPGAAFGPAKQWPVHYFAELSELWTQQGGAVVIVGTPSEMHICSEVASNCKSVFNLAGQTDLRDLIAIIRMAHVCVTNDSGSMHLAAACDATGIAVFGSTSPIATGPLGGKWLIASDEAECAPCLKRECPLKTKQYHCLTGVSVEDVHAALLGLLGV